MVFTLPYGNARVMTVLVAAMLATAAPMPVTDVPLGAIQVSLFLSIIQLAHINPI